MTESNTDAGQQSGPNPALRSPDGLVGTREKSDPGEAGAEDGDSLAGRRGWTQDGEEMAYDAIITRVEER
jgi:hypothetical protein